MSRLKKIASNTGPSLFVGKNILALLLFVASLGNAFILGCSVEKTTDEKIAGYFRQRYSDSGFSISYHHFDKKQEFRKEPFLWKGQRIELTWGTLSISPDFGKFGLANVNGLKDKSSEDLEVFIRNIHINTQSFIQSLGLEREVERRYLDFKTELYVNIEDPNFRRLTVMEVDKRGKFKSYLFRIEVDDSSLKKATHNYESQFLKKEEADETYICTLRLTNKNEKIPLYLHDIILEHKETGRLEYKSLRKGSEFKLIDPEGIVRPKVTKDFQMRVDGYYGRYGDLRASYKLEVGWLE